MLLAELFVIQTELMLECRSAMRHLQELKDEEQKMSNRSNDSQLNQRYYVPSFLRIVQKHRVNAYDVLIFKLLEQPHFWSENTKFEVGALFFVWFNVR